MPPTSANGVTLTDLNYFMQNYPTGIVVPSEYFWNSLYDGLKANLQTDGFYGDMAEILIQNSHPFTGQAFGENVSIPYPDDMDFVKQYIPLKEVIVNAGVSKQAMDRAIGGNSSWGRVVDRVLQAQRTDFLWLMELSSIGDGTGRLGRVLAEDTGAPVTTDRVRITLDNTYDNFGWENSALIKKGMWIEMYDSSGTKVVDGNSLATWQVSNVWFGDRDNGAAATPAYTSGSEVACIEIIALDATRTALGTAIDDGTIIYMANTRSLGLSDSAAGTSCYVSAVAGTPKTSLPMGLVGIVQTTDTNDKYSDGSIDCTLSTFQGLTRSTSTYTSLRANVYDAGDFGGTRGTPYDWDLSVISDAISKVDRDSGGKTDLLMCSSELAMAINRRNRAESNITVNVSNSTEQNQSAVGAQYAQKFLCPDGRVINIMVSRTIPRNVLYGLCTDDLRWFVKGQYDFLRLDGDIWSKSFDDRKANFEAPFGGMHQIGAERCDRQFVIMDMKDNI